MWFIKVGMVLTLASWVGLATESDTEPLVLAPAEWSKKIAIAFASWATEPLLK